MDDRDEVLTTASQESWTRGQWARFVAGIALLLGVGVAAAATGIVDRLDWDRVDRGVAERAAQDALLSDEGIMAEVSCADAIDEDVGATTTCEFTVSGWMTGPFDPFNPRPDRVGRAEFRIEEFEDTWWSDSADDAPPQFAVRVIEPARER
jgi:hypothetical protein